MRYDRLVQKVAETTGFAPQCIKDVLNALPQALMDLQPGTSVRTPLGVFKGIYKGERWKKLPDGKEVRIKPDFSVKLKEHKCMSIQIDE